MKHSQLAGPEYSEHVGCESLLVLLWEVSEFEGSVLLMLVVALFLD